MATERGYLTVQKSWGVASARHVSGLSVKNEETPYLFDAPLGPSIVRWNVKTGERVFEFQAHSDLVVCMRMSPDGLHIATCCSGGTIKIWNCNWNLVSETKCPIQSLFHLGWSSDSKNIVIVGNGHNSSVILYDSTLQLIWQVPAGLSKVRETSVDNSTTDINSTAGTHDYKYGDAYYMCEINLSGNCFAIEEREGATTLIHLLCKESGRDLKTISLHSISGRREVHTVMMSSLHNGRYLIMVEGGYVVMVTAEDVIVSNVINMGYTSRTCVWDKDLIVLPSDSGKLTWLNIDSGSAIHELQVGSSDYIVHIDWSIESDSARYMWVCGFSKLTCCLLKYENDTITVDSQCHVSTHEISCCGVGVSPDSTYLTVGDLAGNVYLYGCRHSDMWMPLEMWNVLASVRCLCWLNTSCLLVGCLDGCVHLWNIGQHVKVLCNVVMSRL